jgi:hypothetical protein
MAKKKMPKIIYLQGDIDCGEGEVSWCSDKIEDDDTEYIQMTEYKKLEKRIAELEAANRWIPVSERLPDEQIWVNATNGIVTFPSIFGYGEWMSSGGWINDVTHWRPLPQPPELV